MLFVGCFGSFLWDEYGDNGARGQLRGLHRCPKGFLAFLLELLFTWSETAGLWDKIVVAIVVAVVFLLGSFFFGFYWHLRSCY